MAAGLFGFVALGIISWDREQADERENLSILSGFLASATQAFFDDLGHGLDPLGQLLQEIDVVNHPEAARSALEKFRKRYPQIGTMAVLDPAGRMLINTALPPGVPLPDYRHTTDYMAPFQAALADPGLYTIGRPEYGQILREWRFPFRHTMRDEQGRPLFMIQAAIPLETGMNFLRTLSLPSNSLVGILREDGFQQARWPADDPDKVYGRRLNGPLIKALHDQPGRRDGYFTGFSPWMYTEQQRLGAYTHLATLPMYAYVSIPYGHIWSKWWEHNSPVLGVFLVFVAIFGAISYWVRIHERQHSDELLNQTRRDSLTGLTNRAGAEELLEHQIRASRESGRPLSIMFFDLDRFKDINDTLGHGIGDQLLIEVGKRTAATLRHHDMLARLGGDEFLIILPDSAPGAAARTAQRLIAVFEAPFQVARRRLKMSCSIGLAFFPDHGTDRETLLKHADTAMYEAKRLGRSGFSCFEAGLGERLQQRITLEAKMRDALAAQQFRLHYQPIIDLKSGRVLCAEALLRWRDTDGVEHSPAQFIPVAEESGLILPLGEWVLKTACAQAREWLDQGFDLNVAVNLSTRQFQDPDLLGKLTSVIRDCGLPPSRLELEITESAAMLDPESSVAVLGALKRIGVRIAIDDFGTGYSSLSYLKRLPVDTIKIDKNFVDGVSDESEDKAIVRAIIALANALNKHTIAEGIETAEQKQALEKAGCQWGQGYLFSRPLPADEFQALLADVSTSQGRVLQNNT
ncbi:MAG: putative bifunctional diguanylate cyclase/phosphodiesterase [Thiobacillus sp.]